MTADHAHIFGMLSLIFWTMILLVTVKYVWIVMRTDNHGEGGATTPRYARTAVRRHMPPGIRWRNRAIA